MKRLKMLPHVWQTVGVVFQIVCLLVLAVCGEEVLSDMNLIASTNSHNGFGHEWGYLVFILSFTLGAVLIALSEEKKEDERIAAIRNQAVIRTIFLYLIIAALNFVATFFLVRLLELQSMARVAMAKGYFTSVPAFILYYVLIFKVSLFVDNKRLGDEE